MLGTLKLVLDVGFEGWQQGTYYPKLSVKCVELGKVYCFQERILPILCQSKQTLKNQTQTRESKALKENTNRPRSPTFGNASVLAVINGSFEGTV